VGTASWVIMRAETDHDLRSQVLAAFDGEAHVSALALSDELGVALDKVQDTIDTLAKEGLIHRVFCWILSPRGEAELEPTIERGKT
jgi:predicted ArsR family transcriptional regulator